MSDLEDFKAPQNNPESGEERTNQESLTKDLNEKVKEVNEITSKFKRNFFWKITVFILLLLLYPLAKPFIQKQWEKVPYISKVIKLNTDTLALSLEIKEQKQMNKNLNNAIDSLKENVWNIGTFRGRVSSNEVKFGGIDGYCKYSIQYKNVIMTAKVDIFGDSIYNSSITALAYERIFDCQSNDTTPIPLNEHRYTMDTLSSIFKNDSLIISYKPDILNKPQCSCIFRGIIKGNLISGTLKIRRIDYPKTPALTYEVPCEINLMRLRYGFSYSSSNNDFP